MSDKGRAQQKRTAANIKIMNKKRTGPSTITMRARRGLAPLEASPLPTFLQQYVDNLQRRAEPEVMRLDEASSASAASIPRRGHYGDDVEEEGQIMEDRSDSGQEDEEEDQEEEDQEDEEEDQEEEDQILGEDRIRNHIIIRQPTCRIRRVILFPNQMLTREQVGEMPTPVWLVGLTRDVESLQSFLVNDILPFELIDRIRYYIDPTEEHFAERRAQRRDEREAAGRQVTDMTSLLERLKEVTQGDLRRTEVLNFARVIGNFFTSVEAPGRIEGSTVCMPIPCTSLSQGDESLAEAGGKKQTRKFCREFADLRPAQLANQLQAIIDMAGNADFILRTKYGVNARFAIWSPYGPGAAGLKRLFLIYDGVIEPHLAAHLAANNDVELVDALNIVTAAAGGGTIVAEAVARVTFASATIQTVGARVLNQGAAAAVFDRGDWEPATEIILADGTVQSLLKIPIRNAYQAWYTAQWVQSHLRHEERVGPDILAAHCRMIEFKLGYNRGTQFRHMPTFYQITVQPAMEAIQGRLTYIARPFIDKAKESGKNFSSGAEWFCNLLGVSTERRIGAAKDEASASAAAAPAPLTQADLDDLARLNAQEILRQSLTTSWEALPEGVQENLRSVRASSRIVKNTGIQSIRDIQQGALAVQKILHEISVDERMQRIAIAMGEAGTAAAASGRQVGSTTVASSKNVVIKLGKHGKRLLSNPESACSIISNCRDLTQIPHPDAIQTNVTGVMPLTAPLTGTDIVGGGVALHCIPVQANQQIADPSIMTVSPIVVLAGEGIEPVTVITTLDNAVATGKVNVEQVQEVVQGMLSRLEQGYGMGIRGKKGPKRLTRRERKGRKGCKGTKKGCKGKKERGRGIGNGTKKRGKGRGTSHKSMPPTNTMRILKQKLKL